MEKMGPHIRDYRPGDESAASYICLKTGDHGQDGEPLFRDDPDALSRIYTEPYLRFAPELALMLEDDVGVCGYAMAVQDSHEFYDRYERDYRPELCKRFPAPTGDAASWTPLESVYHLYHHPDYFCPEPYDQFPAHLHIDLLPRAQGKGIGRQMIQRLCRRLAERHVPGVHLGLSVQNGAAYGFYKAVGFEELTRHDDAIYMGLRLSPDR
jgi:ribosomal protein S18 acetylase RimI-like enzyme